jgi:hypothetical protein
MRLNSFIQNDSGLQNRLQSIITNLRPTFREEELEGRPHLVVPVVMMTEGVHNGSGGPIYYPADELKRACPAWNHKPIIVYHPIVNNVGSAACGAKVLNSQKIGVLLDTTFDTKQRAEAWLEVGRLEKVFKGSEILANIKNSQITEVSTGLFTDLEMKSGFFNDDPYDAIALNHRPDHLAILPDQVGACSVSKGAGLLQLNQAMSEKEIDRRIAVLADLKDTVTRQLRQLVTNEMSHSHVWSNLSKQVREKFSEDWDVWLEDVFDTFFIYSQNGKLLKQDYTSASDAVSIGTGEPQEVVRVTEYRTVGGSFVGNSTHIPSSEEQSMDKKQLVDALIANQASSFEEKDREQLMLLNEETLKKLTPVENSGTTTSTTTTTSDGMSGQGQTPPVQNQQQVPTFDQLLNSAPAEYREMFHHGVEEGRRKKSELITKIVANAKNKFSKEYLETQRLDVLQGIAALAETPAPTSEFQGSPLFAGAAAPVFNYSGTQPAHKEDDILDLPIMNFGSEQPETSAAK